MTYKYFRKKEVEYGTFKTSYLQDTEDVKRGSKFDILSSTFHIENKSNSDFKGINWKRSLLDYSK